jgi:Lon protease-like protein
MITERRAESRRSFENMVDTIPLFPLAAVLLPGTSMPLHIFEPRYRQLTLDLITGALPARRFGVIAKKPGWTVDVHEAEQVQRVGCAAVLREVKRLPDGRFDIVATGERRFRLLEIDPTSAPYLLGVVQWLPDASASTPNQEMMSALVTAARAAHRGYCRAAWLRDDWTEPPDDTDPAQLAHVIATDCLLAADDRQRLLEERCPAKRLRLTHRLLTVETAILATLRAVPMEMTDLDDQINLN